MAIQGQREDDLIGCNKVEKARKDDCSDDSYSYKGSHLSRKTGNLNSSLLPVMNSNPIFLPASFSPPAAKFYRQKEIDLNSFPPSLSLCSSCDSTRSSAQPALTMQCTIFPESLSGPTAFTFLLATFYYGITYLQIF